MAIAGPFGWVQALTGQTDANEELRQMSNQRAMVDAAAVAPRDVTGPGAQSRGIQPPQPASPEPLAYQTPQSWGSVLLDLQQQNERQEGFQTALAASARRSPSRAIASGCRSCSTRTSPTRRRLSRASCS